MSLSTSNSRTIYLKIIVAIGLGMGVSMGLIRLLTHLNPNSGGSPIDRVNEARDALPKIVLEDKDLVMFFGSSTAQAGFSPRQFDREMEELGIDIKSFNFGFGGLNPLFQDLLARRVRDAFLEKNRRLKLALIEFNPFQVTVTRRNGARDVEDSYFTLLASDRELWEMALEEPTRGIRMLNIRYLRDSISAEMITSFYGRSFQTPRPRTAIPKNESVSRRLDELGDELNKRFKQDYPDLVSSLWSYPWQGGGTLPEERSPETLEIFREYYQLFHDDYYMDNDRIHRINTTDIIDLHFDEALVAAFVQIVKHFQQFSDQVEVVLLPKNTAWIQNPPDALERLRHVVDRIHDETGVSVRNWQEIEAVPPELFSDTTHLNRYFGAAAFTHFLVEHYHGDLK